MWNKKIFGILIFSFICSALIVILQVTQNNNDTGDISLRQNPTDNSSLQAKNNLFAGGTADNKDNKPLDSVDFGDAVVGLRSSIKMEASENNDVVKFALEKVNSGDGGEQIDAILSLVRNSPNDAVSVIYRKLELSDEEVGAEGVAALGILSLANQPEALTNADLIYINAQSENENIKARTARVLSHRGDDSLLGQLINTIEERINNASETERGREVLQLGYLQSKQAVPAIVPNLQHENEQIRLDALSALSMSGNEEEVDVVRPLLYDRSAVVRQRAELVLDVLLHRGMKEPVPVDIMLNAPSSRS